MRHLFILFISLLVSSISLAQKPSHDPVVQYLNSKLNPAVNVEAKKKYTIQFYKNGSLYRDDTFHPYEIDSTSIRYSIEEHSIILECRTEMSKCIYRNIYSSKIQGPYNRIAIEVKAEDADKMIEAFKYMCHFAQDKDFTELFKID